MNTRRELYKLIIELVETIESDMQTYIDKMEGDELDAMYIRIAATKELMNILLITDGSK